MSSYLITGGNRGIGWSLVKSLSDNPANTIITIVRNRAALEEKLRNELPKNENIHVIQGDILDVTSLKTARFETLTITGGSLDVLIANAGVISDHSSLHGISELYEEDPDAFDADITNLFNINVVAQIHLVELFLPLIKKGIEKKIVFMGSGMSDDDLVRDYDMWEAAPYSISKSALNMVAAKYHAEYKGQGILFMVICPGSVATGHFDNLSGDRKERTLNMVAKFEAYSPGNPGAISPEDSAEACLEVIGKATIEKNGGKLISHFGNRTWV